MDEKFAPGSFGCHEALHTASVIMDLVEQSLLEHPAIRDRPEWRELADAAHRALFDLYQAIGAEHLTVDEQETADANKRWAKARRLALRNLEEMTEEEDAAITSAALADPDAQPADELLRTRGKRWKA